MRRLRFAVLFVSAAVAGVADPSPEIARLYTTAAYEALLAGDDGRARALVSVGLEFDATSSDLRYVAALARGSARETVWMAIEDASAAVADATWRQFTPTHGAVTLAALLNRTGRHDEALATLGRVERDPRVPPNLIRAFYHESLRALSERGTFAELDELLTSAMDRFPDDPALFHYRLMREPFPSEEYRLEIERLMTTASPTFRPYAAISPRRSLDEVILEYGRRAPTAAERAWALDSLRDRGWSDPRIVFLEPSVSASTVSRFVELGGLANLSVLRELAGVADREQRARLEADARGFSGTALVDRNRDGVWDERVTVESGLITRWERDRNQDGRHEVDTRLGPRGPIEVVIGESDRITVRYGRYPYVESTTRAVDAGTERFVMRPRAMRLDVFSDLAPDGARYGPTPELVQSVRVPRLPELIEAAVQIELRNAEGAFVERSYVLDSVRRAVERDGSGDGEPDHFLVTNGGLAVAGVRDLDADGRFEIAEGYRNGRLVALAVDSDDDGAPDVFERGAVESIREWDLDGDGAIDVREFGIWTESVMQEFPFLTGNAR